MKGGLFRAGRTRRTYGSHFVMYFPSCCSHSRLLRSCPVLTTVAPAPLPPGRPPPGENPYAAGPLPVFGFSPAGGTRIAQREACHSVFRRNFSGV